MALTEHQSGFIDRSSPVSFTGEALRIEDELDRVQMDVDAGRLSEARAKFVNMDRALRETPRALMLRAKSSPSRDSRIMLAALARESLKRVTEMQGRLYLVQTLALCGDFQSAGDALPEAKNLTPGQEEQRKVIVALLGGDPDKAPDRRSSFLKWLDRWLGFDV